MGSLAGARPSVEQALAIRRRALGEEHPDTAQSLNNLGQLLQEMGDLAGARPYFEQALTTCQRRVSPDHPNTNIARANLERLLAERDRWGAQTLVPTISVSAAIHQRSNVSCAIRQNENARGGSVGDRPQQDDFQDNQTCNPSGYGWPFP